jgi:toxin ParE1/3/4
MKVFRSAKAQEDLVQIWIYIAMDSERAFDRVLDAIEGKFDALGDFPEIGGARDDIRPGLRMLVSSEYVILYRVSADGVDIVRVVHGQRDLEALKD